ncbi:hypothetical protein ACFYU8_28445, partial [Brevibacillus sp. NPDC003359]
IKQQEKSKRKNGAVMLLTVLVHISEAEIPRHFFLRWVGLQRRLDWKCASSTKLLFTFLKVKS